MKTIFPLLLLFMFLPLAFAVTDDDITKSMIFYGAWDTNCTTESSIYAEQGADTDTNSSDNNPHDTLTNLGNYCDLGTDVLLEYDVRTADQFDSGISFSINFWMYHTGSPALNTELIAIDDSDSDGVNIFYNHGPSGNDLIVRYGSLSGQADEDSDIDNTAFADGSWHMLTITHNTTASENNMRFYLDGAIQKVEATPGAIQFSLPYFRFGGKNTADGRNVQKLDEFLIVNKTLNQSEIDYLYNSGNGESLLEEIVTPTPTFTNPNTSGLSFNDHIVFNVSCSAGANVTLYYDNSDGSTTVATGTTPLLWNNSAATDFDSVYYYKAECDLGDTSGVFNMTYTGIIPDINFTNPIVEIFTKEPLFEYNGSVFDYFLYATNFTLYLDGQPVFNNYTENYTIGHLNFSQSVDFSSFGYGEYIGEMCSSDSESDSPNIKDKLSLGSQNRENDIYSVISYNGVKISRSIGVVTPSNLPMPRQSYDLDINEIWLNEMHLKLDILFNKLPSHQHKLKVEYACIEGCHDLKFLQDRGRIRVIDSGNNIKFNYDDALNEGWDISYKDNEKVTLYLKASENKYNSLSDRVVIDPITTGLNKNCVNASSVNYQPQLEIAYSDPTPTGASEELDFIVNHSITSGVTTSALIDLDNTLLIGLPFNNSIEDISSKANTITIYDNAQLSTENKLYGDNLLLDGISDRLRVESPLDYAVGNEFTLSFWVYPKNTAFNRRIYWKRNAYYMEYRTTGALHIYVYQSGGYRRVIPVSTLPTNEWTLLTMVYNLTEPDSLNVYFNDNLDKTETLSGTGGISDHSNNLYVGSYESGGVFSLDGYMDNFYLINRTLTHSEVKLLYNSTINNLVNITAPYGSHELKSYVFDTSGVSNNTQIQSFSNSAPNEPPTAAQIITPANDTIIIGEYLFSWNEFSDPDFDILTYNISLFNTDLTTFNVTIGSTTELNISYDTALVDDGNYSIKVVGCDAQYCAESINAFVYVNNTEFIFFINDTGIDFLEVNECPNRTIQDVLLLAFMGLILFVLYFMMRTIVKVPIITIVVLVGWMFYSFTLLGCDKVMGIILLGVSLALMIEAVLGSGS